MLELLDPIKRQVRCPTPRTAAGASGPHLRKSGSCGVPCDVHVPCDSASGFVWPSVSVLCLCAAPSSCTPTQANMASTSAAAKMHGRVRQSRAVVTLEDVFFFIWFETAGGGGGRGGARATARTGRRRRHRARRARRRGSRHLKFTRRHDVNRGACKHDTGVLSACSVPCNQVHRPGCNLCAHFPLDVQVSHQTRPRN